MVGTRSCWCRSARSRSPWLRWRSARHRAEARRYERRPDMITEIVIFGIPDGMTREEVVANYRRSVSEDIENTRIICSNGSYCFGTNTKNALYVGWEPLPDRIQTTREALWPIVSRKARKSASLVTTTES